MQVRAQQDALCWSSLLLLLILLHRKKWRLVNKPHSSSSSLDSVPPQYNSHDQHYNISQEHQCILLLYTNKTGSKYSQISILRPYRIDSLIMDRCTRNDLDPNVFRMPRVMPGGKICHNTMNWCVDWQAMWRILIICTSSKCL